jgi:hypothetical protein
MLSQAHLRYYFTRSSSSAMSEFAATAARLQGHGVKVLG